MKTLPIDFGVWAYGLFPEKTPSIYYRIETPLLSMYELGLANVHMARYAKDRHEDANILLGADVALYWNQHNEGTLGMARQLKAYPAAKDNHGAFRVPPSLIYDTDDYVEMISPFNPDFVSYGTRAFNGEELEPDSALLVPDEKGDRPLWIDKQTVGKDGLVWDIARNKQTIQMVYDVAREAAGVTVTTERLARVFRDKGVENVYVYPNSVREEDYTFFELAPHEGVRILWQGGASHFEDWLPILDPLKEVMAEFPKVKLITWGQTFGWGERGFNVDQIEHHEWIEHAGYLMKRGNLGIDINLAPLADRPFNHGKSSIKFYEASLGPRPEATLAANVPPYSDDIEAGVSGLLYDSPQDFKEKLTAYIKNKELRMTHAGRAQAYVRANRLAKVTGVGLYDFYQEIRRKARMEALAKR